MPIDTEETQTLTAEELAAQEAEKAAAREKQIRHRAREAAEKSAMDPSIDMLAVPNTGGEIMDALRTAFNPIAGYFFSFINGDNSHNDAFALVDIRRSRYAPTTDKEGGLDNADAATPFSVAAADMPEPDNRNHEPAPAVKPENPAA